MVKGDCSWKGARVSNFQLQVSLEFNVAGCDSKQTRGSSDSKDGFEGRNRQGDGPDVGFRLPKAVVSGYRGYAGAIERPYHLQWHAGGIRVGLTLWCCLM